MSSDHKKPTAKILWINPVNISTYDQPVADLLSSIKRPDVAVDVVSLHLPPPLHLTNLEYRASQAAVWDPITQVAHWTGQTGYAACCIGCFDDTALEEARSVSGACVVRAPCEASIKIIDSLCEKFSIIVPIKGCISRMRERIKLYGQQEKVASFRSFNMHVDELQKDKKKTESAIRNAVKLAIEEDGAQGIVLGCTIEFGFFETLQAEFGVPVVDCLCAAYLEAEASAVLQTKFGWASKHTDIVDAGQKRLMEESGIFRRDVPIGNRVEVPATE